MGEFKGENLFEAYLFILIFIIFITIFAISAFHRKDNQLIKFSALLYGAMFVMSSMTILSYYLDYSRVFIDIYFFLLLSINTDKIPIKSILFLALGLGSFAFLALHS
jgi:hypothetical protein